MSNWPKPSQRFSCKDEISATLRKLKLLSVTLLVLSTLIISASFSVRSAKAASLDTNSTNDPILFIHGFDAGSAADCSLWDNAISFLGQAQPFVEGQTIPAWNTSNMLTVGYYANDTNCDINLLGESVSYCTNYFDGNDGTNNESIRHLACEFAWSIYNGYSQYGQNVQIVAYSMGGLITRYALAETQAQDPNFPPFLFVHDVVTLDTPHGGLWGASSRIMNFCNSCVESEQMQAGTSFMNYIYNLTQNPQGADGTDWTLLGSESDGILCQDLDPSVATYMNGGHDVIYYDPCYFHEGVPGWNLSNTMMGDTSTNLDSAVSYCNNCTFNSPNWQYSPYNYPHPLLETDWALYSSDY